MESNELELLAKDIREYQKIGDSALAKWVPTYLTPNRISFYHSFLDSCVENNIDFAGKVVADFGTCTGYLLRLISKKFKPKKIFGYDSFEGYVNLAKHLVPEATIEKHDIMNRIDKKFDIIILTEVLEHLVYPEEALNRFSSMLNENGVCLITVPDGRIDNLYAGPKIEKDNSYSGHINFWSIESFELLMQKNFNDSQYSICRLYNNNIIKDSSLSFMKILSYLYNLSLKNILSSIVPQKSDKKYTIFCILCPNKQDPST